MEADKRARILYIVDYLPNVANSVGEIFSNILSTPKLRNTIPVVACSYGVEHCLNSKKTIEGAMCYLSSYSDLRSAIRNSDCSFLSKLDCIIWKVLHQLFSRIGFGTFFDNYTKRLNLQKIIRHEDPQIVVFFVFSPDSVFADVCQREKKPYIYIYYMTHLLRDRALRKQIWQQKKR